MKCNESKIWNSILFPHTFRTRSCHSELMLRHVSPEIHLHAFPYQKIESLYMGSTVWHKLICLHCFLWPRTGIVQMFLPKLQKLWKKHVWLKKKKKLKRSKIYYWSSVLLLKCIKVQPTQSGKLFAFSRRQMYVEKYCKLPSRNYFGKKKFGNY